MRRRPILGRPDRSWVLLAGLLLVLSGCAVLPAPSTPQATPHATPVLPAASADFAAMPAQAPVVNSPAGTRTEAGVAVPSSGLSRAGATDPAIQTASSEVPSPQPQEVPPPIPHAVLQPAPAGSPEPASAPASGAPAPVAAAGPSSSESSPAPVWPAVAASVAPGAESAPASPVGPPVTEASPGAQPPSAAPAPTETAPTEAASTALASTQAPSTQGVLAPPAEPPSAAPPRAEPPSAPPSSEPPIAEADAQPAVEAPAAPTALGAAVPAGPTTEGTVGLPAAPTTLAMTPPPGPAPSVSVPEQASSPPVLAWAPSALPAPSVIRPAEPLARDWTEYRRLAALRMVAANPQGSYTTRAPDPLLAIPVVEVLLQEDGTVEQVLVLRSPSQARDTLRLAEEAIRRAGPFGPVSHLPKPWRFTEVFLFDHARRFKPMILDR